MTTRTDEPLFAANDWHQLRALVDRLENLSAEAQAAELAQLDATNPARAEVARALLAQPSPGASAQLHDALLRVAPRAEAEMPAQIGPFRLLSRIGAGGMGVVYLAERSGADFIQRVALKVLDGDAARMSRLAARERRVLAALAHPNITAFVDGGSENGRAWLAMEYVDGEPLLHYCTRLGLGLRERVQLFDQVCAAVAYAHAQLIVHRDLKPSNILVSSDGAIKLLDFGIALILDAGDEQAPATRVFTPEYAAPEQLCGERVTTATDVYALGLMLYELIVGRRLPTLERAGSDAEWTTAELTRHATTRAGANVQAAYAKTLSRQLCGDLGTILARALKSYPAERYASVQSFADDLLLYLAHRPILAHADSRVYRLRKYVRRHRVGIGIGALLVLAIIAGIGGVVWEARAAKRETARAVAVKNFLTGLFDDTRNTRAGIEVRKASALDILNSGAERLKTELADEPAVRDEIYQMLVEIFDSSGDEKQSFALAQARVASAEAAYGADDARIVPALIMLAGVSINHEKLDVAKPLLARSEALLDSAQDNDSLDRARLWTWQGNLQRLEGGNDAKFDGNSLIKAVDLLRRRYPKEDDFNVALFMYASLAVSSGHLAEAEKATVEMHDSAAARYGENTVYVTQADLMRARVLLKESKFDEAAALSKIVVNGFVKFEGQAHPDVLYAEVIELNALINLQRMDEARTLFAKADAERREKFPDNPRLAKGYAGIAMKLGL